MDDPTIAEAEAFSAYQRWVSEGRQVRDLFLSLRMELPPSMQRMFAYGSPPSTPVETGTPTQPDGDADPNRGRFDWIKAIPELSPARPPDIDGDNLIWVRIEKLTPMSFFLGCLNTLGDVSSIRTILEYSETALFQPELTVENISKAAKRLLSMRRVAQKNGHWTLAYGVLAPTFYGLLAWGPPDAFTRHEVASYRRDIIEHVLLQANRPLGLSELVRAMETPRICLVGGNNTTVSGALDSLENDGLVKQNEEGKWTLVEPEPTET